MEKEIYLPYCYINPKNKNTVKFKYKKEIKEIPFNIKYFKYKFPKKKGLKYSKLKMSNIGKYSISSSIQIEDLCKTIKKNLKKKITITDATGGIGGSTLVFAKYFNVNFSNLNSPDANFLLISVVDK